MTDIFISYSSQDKHIADAICAKIEQQNIKCWIAPRDIHPGEEYAAGIIRGIDNCKCMIIVFSETSNHSKHVLREVERAVTRGIVIIPFRIENIMPSGSMDYFLKVAHWLDAIDGDMDEAFSKLSQSVTNLLNQPIVSESMTPKSNNVQNEPSTNYKKYGYIVLSFIVLGMVIITGYMWKSKENVIGEKMVSTLSPETNRTTLLKNLIQGNEKLLNQASRKNIDSTLDFQLQIPNNTISIKSWSEPDRSVFLEGDKIKFKVSLDYDAYLAVYVHSMDGGTYLIYPNHLSSPKLIHKNTLFSVGGNETFELEIAEPYGVDIIHFIATTDKVEFQKLLSKHKPIDGLNIATFERAQLIQEMKGIKAKGIQVKETSKNTNNTNNKLWGSSLLLIYTKPQI